MANLQPTAKPQLVVTRFGFNRYAEKFNGRAAMIGFAALVIIEFLTGQSPLALVGIHLN
jgi:Chlorophyll A-B binding protein